MCIGVSTALGYFVLVCEPDGVSPCDVVANTLSKASKFVGARPLPHLADVGVLVIDELFVLQGLSGVGVLCGGWW